MYFLQSMCVPRRHSGFNQSQQVGGITVNTLVATQLAWDGSKEGKFYNKLCVFTITLLIQGK